MNSTFARPSVIATRLHRSPYYVPEIAVLVLGILVTLEHGKDAV